MSNSSHLQVTALKTKIFELGEVLEEFVCSHLEKHSLKNGMVVVVTSKIVSLSENRVVSTQSISKTQLVRQEADTYLGETAYGCHLTIKEGLFIPSAGIDESNSRDRFYILYPQQPFKSAQKLHQNLCQKFNLSQLGILITDSHTTPLRVGVSGIALAHWGFKGIKNLIGQPDLFGSPLKMTQINIADSLASAAVLMMGEANEQTPLALIQGMPLEFTPHTDSHEMRVDPKVDLYAPLFSNL